MNMILYVIKNVSPFFNVFCVFFDEKKMQFSRLSFLFDQLKKVVKSHHSIIIIILFLFLFIFLYILSSSSLLSFTA